jgi:hypothetical protein
MAVDENQVRKAIEELTQRIIDAFRTNPNTNEDKLKELFNNYKNIVNQTGLIDEEVENIIYKATHKSEDNRLYRRPELFREEMREFTEKELIPRLKRADKESEKRKKEQEKEQDTVVGERIVQIGPDVPKILSAAYDAGVAFFDRLKEKASEGKLYYYVWWLLDNENDYKTLISDPHAYPRNRGKLKVYYKEIGSKNVEEALKGEKSSEKVTGEFLGALGIVGRNIEFEDDVPRVELQPGQIIALGAARAKRWDWRTREYRGLTEDKLMRFDPERLIWKWNSLNSAGKEKFVGPVPKTKSKKTKKEPDSEKELTISLDKWAKKYNLEKNPDIGLKWHYKGDEVIMKKIKENFERIVEANKTDGRLIINNKDVTSYYNLAKDELETVIKAWSESNPELLNKLVTRPHAALFNGINAVLKAISEKKIS